MATDRELDTNDKALVQYFLRGMRRFEKHILTQDISETAPDATWKLIGEKLQDTVETRIEAAYRLARSQFTSRKETK